MEVGLKTLHAPSVASAASAMATARLSMKHEWGGVGPPRRPPPQTSRKRFICDAS